MSVCFSGFAPESDRVADIGLLPLRTNSGLMHCSKRRARAAMIYSITFVCPPPLAVLWGSRTWGFLSSAAVVASIVVGAVAVVLAPERNTQLLTDRAIGGSIEQTGGSPCRRLKKEIRKERNRRRTRTSLRPNKSRPSRPSTRSRERPEARGRSRVVPEPRFGVGRPRTRP